MSWPLWIALLELPFALVGAIFVATCILAALDPGHKLNGDP